jgi:hypothetical protein
MKASLYSILGVTLALSGVIALGFVYYPILNPVQFSLTPGPEISPTIRYLIGTPAALLVLLAGWYFNVKAMRLKRDKQKRNHL